MAQASHKHFGVHGSTGGKGDGTGAMSEVEPEDIPANMILSNRDKASHDDKHKSAKPGDFGDARGLDGADVQTEQMQDHPGNRLDDGEEGTT